jgi:acyl-homoserine lactone acylase PvdQ
MKQLFILVVGVMGALVTMGQTNVEKQRWALHAKQTTIIRDEWDIPHIYGKTDADAVFGLLYAQCEENFSQIEKNFLEMLGRKAELEGSKLLYEDLMMRLIQDSVAAIKDFNRCPASIKKLLVAHADGINYYLSKHPEVQPKVIKHFEPWFHLMWTDGSVSPTRSAGINEKHVAAFYGKSKEIVAREANPFDMEEKTLKGSNGFAIAPSHSKTGTAMLYINPHVPFYFRSEMHMVSEEGLNVYGAVTWGQMFIYQGFNAYCGWMHTSSYADVADVFEETMEQKNGTWFYKYDNVQHPVTTRMIPVRFNENGVIQTKTFTTYATLHGPIMGTDGAKWLSLKENNRSLNALIECWIRTKSKGLDDYKNALRLLANNSNNTVYADAKGNIAYWHGNFMPKRDATLDYTKHVDGSTSKTNWKGLHPLEEIVQSINPSNGWLQNCNATPYAVAGENSPKEKDFPAYMAPDGQNARGINALRLLSSIDKIDINDLIHLGYNKHMAGFDIVLPPFISSTSNQPLSPQTKKAISYLANWNKEADSTSIATTLAIEWGTKCMSLLPPPSSEEAATHILDRYELINQLPVEKRIELLEQTLAQLEKWYGTWEVKWGDINRYQRVNPGATFNDSAFSWGVAQGSSRWGTLPAFESRRTDNTVKRYGYSGNSFIAAVNFGKKIEAKTIITGGQSRFASSTHFTDQAKMYLEGNFKTIHFYKEDVLAHQVIKYNPGLER